MSRSVIWMLSVALGAGATVLINAFPFLPGTSVLLALLLALATSRRAVAVSGVLCGFGAFSVFLTAREMTTTAALDNADFWILVGIAALLVGLVLLLRSSAPGNAPAELHGR